MLNQSEYNHHLSGVFVLPQILSRHWCCVETESRAPDEDGGWPARLSSCPSESSYSSTPSSSFSTLLTVWAEKR
jgi:hypothetical protein